MPPERQLGDLPNLPDLPDDVVQVGQALAPRVLLFGFPFSIALMLATQDLRECGGGSRSGIGFHSIVSLLATSSVSLALVALWAWYRVCVRAASPEVCTMKRIPWSATTGWLESVDLATGVILSYANMVMVLQLVEAVLVRSHIATYATVVTIVVCVAGTVGMWADEIVRMLTGEPPRWGFLMPQLVPVLAGLSEILGARRTGHFERMSCEAAGGGPCRARIALAFVAFITSSWAVVANLHQEIMCMEPATNIWSTDGASDVLDLILLEISAFACFTCDWRADGDTAGRVAVGVLLVGALYGLSCAWLQTTVVL
jgi:hypothetical protein